MGIDKVTKAIFLDRDGIILEPVIIGGKSHPPSCVSAMKFIDGIEELLDYLVEFYSIFVVTNQPDVARGIQTQEEVEAMHKKIYKKLPQITDIWACYHDDKDNCQCRKPKIGMLLDASYFYDINLKESFVCGDRWRDIECGQNAGCSTIFVDYGWNEKQPTNPTYTVKSVKEIKGIFEKEIV